MTSNKSIKNVIASAVALTVAGTAGAAAAEMIKSPSNSNLIRVGNHGCEGKDGCEGHAEKAKDGAKKEKCYGVAKAGHNDCANAAGTHSCAGYSKTDGDGGEWIALPAGLCEKLVGGSTSPKS